MNNNPLELLMNPRSIATVGAGNNPMKMGTIQALSIVMDGYKGNFYPVHPNDDQIFGYKAYRSPLELPEAPDLVMFVLPAPLVIPILEDFGKIGTRRAIIITAGFRETGEEGKRLEEQLKETASRYGIRFLGPNCMGIINTEISLNVTVLPLEAKQGRLGMASQSGTYITQTLPYLEKRGIRFSKAASVGNEADIGLIDVMEYLGDDEQTGAIALYIEGLKDANRFLEVAGRITPRKPVVAQYVGGSDAGARAGSSHTGALAGPDYLYEGLFKQAGVIRVDTIEELYNQGWALANQPPLRGRRIAVLTNSGGPGTAISHTCSEGGLDVPRFSETLQGEIKKVIPDYGSASNPVDLTFHMDTEAIGATIPRILAESGEVDGLIVHGLMSSGFIGAIYPHVNRLLGFESKEDFLEHFSPDPTEQAAMSKGLGMPMVISSFFGREDDYTRTYQDCGIPVFDAPEKAALAMLALYRYNKIREGGYRDNPVLPLCNESAAATISNALNGGSTVLDEYQSKQILAAYGIPVVREILAESPGQAVKAAAQIGYPVVLKGCSARFAHKTGKGLIYLNLENEEAVRQSYDAIIDAAGMKIPVLVAEMVRGGREMMAGVIEHPGFGPCVMFGLGGIFAEVLKDRVFRLAPLTEADALAMLEDIRAGKMLGSFRGLPAVERPALAGILKELGNLALLHPEIAEIDLNPIIISEAKPVVVDALVVLKQQGLSGSQDK